MRIPITKFCIVKKQKSKQANQLAEQMSQWLEEKKYTVSIGIPDIGSPQPAPELVFVIGGDGTVVSTARYLAGKNIPIMGINLGHVGFLAEFTPAVWEESLEQIVTKGVLLEPRTALSYSLQCKGKILFTGLASNDIVLARGAMARLQTLEIRVNGESLGQLRARWV